MKVAILGSSGFLGTIIKTKFTNKYQVIPITRKELDLLDFNSVSSWLDLNRPEVVINCATVGGREDADEFNYSEAKNNISIFLNFYNNSNKFGKFINIGSGAEFDKNQNIENAKEDEIFIKSPNGSYGYSKNLISRLCREKTNFYTLRLFGCFHHTEPQFRLFKKYNKNPNILIEDRKFDYISAEDFLIILEYSINNKLEFRDINCVYEQKISISEIIRNFNEPKNILLSSKNYTGDGSKLNSLNLPLLGLKASIEIYRKEII